MNGEYVYAEEEAAVGAPLLVLLHGTGGDERDLLDLGRMLMPGARLIAPRGDVLENGMPRYFKRLGMGVYDMADLERATAKLGAFIAAQRERLAPASIAALGYSNGANILASVLFSAPQLVDRAVLLHPLVPFVPQPQPGLRGKPVLIAAGRHDRIAPAERAEALYAYLRAQGAEVEIDWHEGGHEVRPEEVAAAQAFLNA